MKFLLITCFCFLTISCGAQGLIDGFIDSPKSKVVAISGNFETASSYFLWDRDLDFGITSFTASIFFKHQISKNYGYVLSIPFINGTPQDGNLFLKAGSDFSPSKNIKLTGIAAIGGTHPLSNYRTESNTAIGQQTKSLGFRAVGQITFKNQWFINGRYGYNFVADPSPDNSVASLKIGFYKNKWYADLWFDQVLSFNGKDYRGLGENNADSFRELGLDTDKIGGVIYHQTNEKLGFFIGGAYTLSGRNAFKTTRVSKGLVLKL